MKGKIGCSGWSYTGWVGSFYPPGTLAEDYLKLYSRVFDAVEIDSTFYGIPSPETVKKWYNAVPDGFIFAPKVPQEITHTPPGPRPDSIMSRFLEVINGLENKLGPILIQFPPSFRYPAGKEKLRDLMDALPGGYSFAVEFRHPSWFNDVTLSDLRSRKIVLAWSDTPFVEPQTNLTSKSIYLRLVGDRSIKESEFGNVTIRRSAQIQAWADRVKEKLDEVQDFVVFVNNHFEGFSPSTANAFRSALGNPAKNWDILRADAVSGKNLFSSWK